MLFSRNLPFEKQHYITFIFVAIYINAVFFLFGYIAYNFFKNKELNLISKISSLKVINKITIIIICFLVICFLKGHNDVFLLTIENPVSFIITSILGTTLILFISTLVKGKLRLFLELCGKNSLHIMGLHKMLISPLYSYFFILYYVY